MSICHEYLFALAFRDELLGQLRHRKPNCVAGTRQVSDLNYWNSQEKPELARPGDVCHITVDLWATSNVFLTGHKLRLGVSSSTFPRFDRNLNTGQE